MSIFALAMAKYVYNPETLSYDVVDESRVLRFFRRILEIAAVLGSVYLFFWLYTSVFGWDLPKTAILKMRHARWESRVDVITRQLDLYEQTLSGIEDRNDDVYRSIYGLGEIPAEIKNAGFGGVNRYAYLDSFGANSDLKNTIRRMDKLTKRAYLQSKALDEVGVISRQAGDMISCVPSVPPILPEPGNFHLSSSFGGRTDPVFGGREFHKGQDIASKKGTPVFVTGDGVVELARCQFTGYGNEIVVDHGYGYKTHYAHLNTIEVNVGMKVHRGDQIGTVGNSGKSTGPHLHYEVIYKGECVNPMRFMDMSMPVEEYEAMVAKRRSESPASKKISNAELIRKRRNG